MRELGISIGVNAVTGACVFSSTGTIAYAAHRSIAIYNPLSDFGVETTLIGHKAKVTCLAWIDESTLVSGSEDCCVNIWRKSESWQLDSVLYDHKKSISCLAVSGYLLITGAMDGLLNVYKIDQVTKKAKWIQSILYKPLLPLTISVSPLPSTDDYIMAVAGTSTLITIFGTCKGDSGVSLQFEKKLTLPGHEDWIRSLDFVEDAEGLLLASSSQDRYIRLWRIVPKSIPIENEQKGNLVLLENKAHGFSVPSGLWKIAFEALLVCHEDWVFSVQFSRKNGELILLSASADSSVILWKADPESEIWTVESQLGTISIKGASTATGATGGFWGAILSPDTNTICAWNKTGSLRLWQQQDDAWRNIGGVGGHVQEVRSLSWSPGGEYFLTTSLDQSTRLWASSKRGTWHEFARPQIHGFDIQSIHVVNPTLFLSGAEEKIVRVFQATSSVVDLMNRVAGIDLGNDSGIEAANVPALGLSNKAISAANPGSHLDRSQLEDTPEVGQTPVSKTMLDTLADPPNEDILQRHTLFPELEKLYGHGYEIQALTSSHDGRYVVSGCRATTPDHAVLRIYDTEKWKELGKLDGHSLTVTKARFNFDDSYLLSVSRDRSWILYARNSSDTGYELKSRASKAHGRIIWDCAWLDNQTFATASRDKTVKIWSLDVNDISNTETIKFDEAVTAIGFSDQIGDDLTSMMAVGLEDGSVHIYEKRQGEPWTKAEDFRKCDGAITAIQWRKGKSQLAYCSENCSVRVAEIRS